MMKQSSRRSKDLLKATLEPKKPITDYQEYEDQLASYQKSGKTPNIAGLFDWSKPSEVLSLKSSQRKQPSPEKKEQPLQNNSMNTDELLRSQRDPNERREEEYQDDSFQVEPSSPLKPSYLDRIQQDYDSEYKNMSGVDIEGELKTMREQILAMNDRLNRMLDKYELMSKQPIKREAHSSNPHLFLTKEIQINARILNKQAQEIRHIQEKDNELEKKDYLVELNELIIEIGKQIHDMGKEKHTRWVDVERIDRMLKELEGIQGTEDQYRQVKELKVKIVYYFKKLKEHKMEEEELDLQMEKLVMKDNQLTKQYEHYTQLAVQKSLQVSTNKRYLQLKKKYDELIVLRQSERKKKDIAIKFQMVGEQKLEREIQSMRKELQRVGMLSQELEYKSGSIDGETTQLIKKHNVLSREIKSISYKFDDSLLHSDRQKFKPDFKRASKAETKDINKTQDHPTDKMSTRLINDKNVSIEEITSNAEQSNLQDSKLKPMLRQWKGKSEKPRYMQSPSAKEYKTLESSNIFKPPLLLKHKK